VIRGAVIPSDGIVHTGSASINESLITGESLPVRKSAGMDVIGGSIVLDGTVFVIVKDAVENSILHQMISLVEGAQLRKAAIQLLADRIAGYFTIIILTISATVFVMWMGLLFSNSIPEHVLPPGRTRIDIAITIAISTLVVSCPCAMGLR
jgi:P-type E1-E2 ATPase